MTDLMERIMQRLNSIPEEKQERYTAVFFKELNADQRWEELFDQTTDEQWTTLVEEAKEEATVPLDQFLNDQGS